MVTLWEVREEYFLEFYMVTFFFKHRATHIYKRIFSNSKLHKMNNKFFTTLNFLHNNLQHYIQFVFFNMFFYFKFISNTKANERHNFDYFFYLLNSSRNWYSCSTIFKFVQNVKSKIFNLRFFFVIFFFKSPFWVMMILWTSFTFCYIFF